MLENKVTESEEIDFISLNKLILLIFIVWLVSGIVLYFVPDHGTFGDMFGAVNALFSGLAFASLIYTIFLQRHELKLQREELSLTRNEIKEQKEYLAAQNEVLRTQNFENTFFQLLKLLNDIVNSIDLVASDRTTKGRDCFSIFYRRLITEYRNSKKNPENQDKNQLELIKLSYASFYQLYQGELGHYFRTLYNLVKFIKHSNVDNKPFYTNLVRAQLSNQELTILFYNCITENGSEKFKPLIEEFAFFKNMSKGDLLSRVEDVSFYEDCAFGTKKP